MNKDGTQPDPVKVEEICNFPVPKDLTNLRSYLGLANQQVTFLLEPLKPLLSGKNAYVWNKALQEALENSKEVLFSEQLLKRFDPQKFTIILTDASRLHCKYLS